MERVGIICEEIPSEPKKYFSLSYIRNVRYTVFVTFFFDGGEAKNCFAIKIKSKNY
ncbi:hypothetical protein PGB90_002972 [Kerria lacca]